MKKKESLNMMRFIILLQPGSDYFGNLYSFI